MEWDFIAQSVQNPAAIEFLPTLLPFWDVKHTFVYLL